MSDKPAAPAPDDLCARLRDAVPYINPEGNKCTHHPDDPACGPACAATANEILLYEAAARIEQQQSRIAALEAGVVSEIEQCAALRSRAEAAEAECDKLREELADLERYTAILEHARSYFDRMTAAEARCAELERLLQEITSQCNRWENLYMRALENAEKWEALFYKARALEKEK